MKSINCMRAKPGYSINLSKILFLLLIFTFIAIPTTPVSSQADCDECANPLVEVMNVKIYGDVPDFSKWGFHSSGTEVMDTICDMMDRGLNYVLNFKKKNPCADTYYILDDGNSHVRVGAKTGNAKYKIETYVEIRTDTAGEMVLVDLLTGTKIKYDPPKIINGKLEEYDLINLEEKPALIPKLGQVEISNQLIALKNGQTYDMSDMVLDWIPDPPSSGNDLGDFEYYGPADESAWIDGKLYTPGDGDIIGEFSPGSISSVELYLDKGDVGVTIRKMETPSSCKLQWDYNSKWPSDFKLKVKDIKNLFDKQMPNNVKIALKVDKGVLRGGETIKGWTVVKTSDGKTTDEILYTPPPCLEGFMDTLEVAGICDYHDGPETVGKTRFTKKITNPKCFDATATLTGTYHKHCEMSKSVSDSEFSSQDRRTYDEDTQATITLNMELTTSVDQLMFGEYWEYYKVTSSNIDSFYATSEEYSYSQSQGAAGHGNETITTVKGMGSQEKFEVPSHHGQVLIVFDKKTKKAKRVQFMISGTIQYTMNITDSMTSKSWGPNGGEDNASNESKTKSKTFTPGPVMEKVKGKGLSGNYAPDLLVKDGDGETYLSGNGSVEKNLSGDECYGYDSGVEKKTFSWSLTRKQKKK